MILKKHYLRTLLYLISSSFPEIFNFQREGTHCSTKIFIYLIHFFSLCPPTSPPTASDYVPKLLLYMSRFTLLKDEPQNITRITCGSSKTKFIRPTTVGKKCHLDKMWWSEKDIYRVWQY